MCPCRAFNEYIDIWVSVFFWDIWVLRDPHFRRKKQKTKKTLNTCAKIQGLTLKNGEDIWTFVRLSANFMAWRRDYLVLAYIRLWALNFGT